MVMFLNDGNFEINGVFEIIKKMNHNPHLKIIARFDPHLEYKRVLLDGSTRITYLVADCDRLRVLKVANCDYDKSKRHAETEVQSLEAARNVPGITHLVRDYGFWGNTRAYLKEYIRGRMAHLCLDNELREMMEETVASLHEAGVARLDSDERNWIVSPDCEKVTLIDLGYSLFAGLCDTPEFVEWKERDFRYLQMN